MLSIKDVSKTYRDSSRSVEALVGVSFDVTPGQFVAVQGPSGCGKSTLLLVAGGLLRPDAGQVDIDGQDPYSLSADGRAEFRAANIGFVFQQFHLVPYLNVLDNIMAPGMAAPHGQEKGGSNGAASGTRERATELMERFGLADRSQHIPGKLSSGERQRVAMARALLNQPKLILADEPTGNLDHDNADTLLGYLAEFAEDGGSVLLVTHDDRAVAQAHSVIHLRDGAVVESAAVR